jgi:hypothetical protein
MSRKIGKVGAIKKFFGMRSGDKLTDFRNEINDLTEEDKLELAQGSALNLQLTQEEVDFPLS